jgi:DNA polymerase V
MWKNHKLDELKQAGVSEKTGFPNAGTDTSLTSLDLAKLLIQNPSSTFFMRLRGSSWEDRGVYDNDIVVIDRALAAKPADLLIWWGGDNFVMGRLAEVPDEIEVWGVVTTVIHRYRP